MYTQPIDRNHPGCILFLLDQSASMEEPFSGTGRSKAAELAKAVNRLIRNLVLQCQRGNEVRNYYEIGIVGYGQTVGPHARRPARRPATRADQRHRRLSRFGWSPTACPGDRRSASNCRSGSTRSRTAAPR